MTHGYHDLYLRIDVGSGNALRVALPEAVLRQYIGGSGLGARLLLY
jgi:aldehyde:ferredoxin oxidoreductase